MAGLKCHSPVICLPPTRLLRLSPLAATSKALLFFSVPQHQNSLLVHAHMRTTDTDNHQTCMQVYAHACTRTQYLLWVFTDWVNAAINGLLYNVSIQNGRVEGETSAEPVCRKRQTLQLSSITIRPQGVIRQFLPQPLSTLALGKLKNITFSYLPIPL